MNTFPYTLDNKRYYTYNYYLRQRYHHKVAKVSIDAGFTCPNRDGTKAKGGCTFCSSGATEFAGKREDDLLIQFHKQKEIQRRKWNDCQFIVYFQSFSNTYAPLEILKEYYELFVGIEDVVGIAIATRADCLNEEIIAYLHELDQKIDVYIELGLQTIHNLTSILVNRQETYEDVKDIVYLLDHYHIKTTLHIINGLPYETKDMMLETVKSISQLPIWGIKIHNLFLTTDSKMYKDFLTNPFPLLSRDEYIHITCLQLEYLREDIVVERLTGDPPIDTLFKPEWCLNKTTLLNDIDKYMKYHDIYQGDLSTSI